MIQRTLVDLHTAAPHEPAGARFSAAEFAVYRAGYAHALIVAMKAVDVALLRFELVERSKRLARRAKRD